MPSTILVVDDEHAILETLSEVIEWEGYAVLTAHDGRRALEILDAEPIDAVLLDFMMPVKDGVETLAEIRERPALAELPVILMTAAPKSIPPDVARYDALLAKPFTIATVLAALASALGGTHA
jgi:two-component system, OmpR family, response regulator VicR